MTSPIVSGDTEQCQCLRSQQVKSSLTIRYWIHLHNRQDFSSPSRALWCREKLLRLSLKFCRKGKTIQDRPFKTQHCKHVSKSWRDRNGAYSKFAFIHGIKNVFTWTKDNFTLIICGVGFCIQIASFTLWTFGVTSCWKNNQLYYSSFDLWTP